MGQLHDVVHVLVVDTDAHRRTLLCTVLRHGGALPLDGEGVEDARRIVERIRPDVVVASLDDGLVDDRSLREAFADVPIIGITADRDPLLRRRALRAGLRALLVTPIDPHHLASLVRDLATRPKR